MRNERPVLPTMLCYAMPRPIRPTHLRIIHSLEDVDPSKSQKSDGASKRYYQDISYRPLGKSFCRGLTNP